MMAANQRTGSNSHPNVGEITSVHMDSGNRLTGIELLLERTGRFFSLYVETIAHHADRHAAEQGPVDFDVLTDSSFPDPSIVLDLDVIAAEDLRAITALPIEMLMPYLVEQSLPTESLG